jgi:gamma-glutamyltranspeptidase/glutathione hydrolase
MSVTRTARSPRGMVATAHHEATTVGAEILADGGNAVDAAVAAAFALGVCEPAASGLGGQTMILMHLTESGRTVALDGSSRAPNRATVEVLPRAQRTTGYRATTVPSTPATLRYALRRYGTMPLGRVLEPSIAMAERGVAVTALQHRLTTREADRLRLWTGGLFHLAGGEPPGEGTLLRQPVLASTYRRLARKGIRDFYSGDIARQIVEDMEAHDGLIRADDLAQVPRPIERAPLETVFRGDRVVSFPPPAAGRTLIEMLNAYTCLPPALTELDSPLHAVALAELIRRAFMDRRDRPFDPNYYPQVPLKKMLSEEHASRLAAHIARLVEHRGETTHLSVMDERGNAVALTQSIEKVYGSACATPSLGFLYNDYLSAFEYEDISHPYYLRPNAAPWASVAPTIAFRDGRPWLVIGSPGSERITSSILQVLLRLPRGTPLEAVAAPRLHCSLDGRVSVEAERMPDGVIDALERHGFDVDRREAFSFYLGCVQLVVRDGDALVGVADPRRDGSAAGPAS